MSALSLLAAAVLTAAPPDTYAIVVGHNGGLAAGEGHGALPRLRFADDDALRFARLFSALGDVQLLVEPDEDTVAEWTRAGTEIPPHVAPTRDAVLAAIAEVVRRLEARPASAPPAAVYFLYAGHGLSGRFLLQNDGTLTGRELVTAFAALPAGRATLFLDACRAQSLFTARGDDDFSAEVATLEARAKQLTLGILTAATSSTPAGETPRLRGGLFSHVLASGLAGAADADGDHIVRFGELAAFVSINTERHVGQRPWFEAPGGNLDAAVVDLRARPTLTLSAELEGRFVVQQPTGFIAEFRKTRGKAMEVLVPDGVTTVVQESEGSTRRATPQAQSAVALTAADFTEFKSERGSEPDDGDAMQPFNNDAVVALGAGYRSGQEPLRTTTVARTSLSARYGLSSAINFTGVEHGGEIAANFLVASPLVIGPRLSVRTATFDGTEGRAQWWRFGVLFEAGLRLNATRWLELLPNASLGAKAVVRVSNTGTRGDIIEPAGGLGFRASAVLSPQVALELEPRVEAAVVSASGAARLYAEPMLLVGLSWRWR
ncbi:MAG: caspase family protein [Archangium sp.]